MKMNEGEPWKFQVERMGKHSRWRLVASDGFCKLGTHIAAWLDVGALLFRYSIASCWGSNGGTRQSWDSSHG